MKEHRRRHLNVRIPDALREKLRERALDLGVSMNSAVILAIEDVLRAGEILALVREELARDRAAREPRFHGTHVGIDAARYLGDIVAAWPA